jgi:hypothetical protein
LGSLFLGGWMGKSPEKRWHDPDGIRFSGHD